MTSLRPRSIGVLASQLHPPAKKMPVNSTVRHIRSNDLFEKDREIVIEHHGVHYRLRLTRANKLILTK